MIYTLDTSAMIAFLRAERGADVVESLLVDAGNAGFAHAINLCETFYAFHRRGGEAAARTAVTTLFSAGVVAREDMDVTFWQEVARLKSPRAHLPLGDCVCIAMAQRLSGELVPCDHPDFDPIASQGVCPVRFIR